MGNKPDVCSCFKKTEDTAIEVELKSGETHKIKIIKEINRFSIKQVDTIRSASLSSKLSNIKNDTNSDSIFIEKNDLKPLINNSNLPEIIIQAVFRGYIYRKKFNELDGLKQELINDNIEIIQKIETTFISNSIKKSEKLFINEYSEDNMKKFYTEDIQNLLQKKKN